MSNFDSVMDDDAANAFCNADEFAESVRYRPRGGAIVTYAGAQVFRDPPPARGDTGPKVKMEVHLPRDAAGVNGPAEINTGGDEIELRYRLGDAVVWYSFGRVPSKEDAGMWVLRIT